MKIPPELMQAVETEVSQHDSKLLAQAADALSHHYRGGKAQGSEGQFVRTVLDRAAYLLTRMPATFAAVSAVLQELRVRAPQLQIHSLIDLGAGPGTAMWAASAMFPELERVTCVEQDAAFISLGKKLANVSPYPVLRSAEWIQGDLRQLPDYGSHDLALISYALGELT